MTPLDMGGLLPEIMWIPMAAIMEEDAVSLAYAVSSIIMKQFIICPDGLF
jgi:hypothetical protein